MIPDIKSIWLPIKDSRTALIMGIPPATAASKYTGVWWRRARAKTSPPRSARRALFPVTTGLPASNDSATSSNASSVPPINSITISTRGFSTMDFQSVVNSSAGAVASRGFAGSRTTIWWISNCTPDPERSVMRPPFLAKAFHTPDPTVPNPARPTPTVPSFVITPER